MNTGAITLHTHADGNTSNTPVRSQQRNRPYPVKTVDVTLAAMHEEQTFLCWESQYESELSAQHAQARLTVTHTASTKMTLDAHYHNRAITCVFQIFLLQIRSPRDALAQSLPFSSHTSTHTNTVNPRLCVTVFFGPSGVATVLLRSSLIAHILAIVLITAAIAIFGNIAIKLDQNHHAAPF